MGHLCLPLPDYSDRTQASGSENLSIVNVEGGERMQHVLISVLVSNAVGFCFHIDR